MELEKIADGLVKSAAAARTLGPIVKPGAYATWAKDLKKVAEAHYSKLRTEKKAEEPAAGNFLTNTFNTLSQNYKSLDPALQNTIAGAGIGAGGGALMGLGSNLLSGRKKKNYLSDMMSMGLMGGLGGGAAGGLYSLATDPGAVGRAAGALGLSTPEPAAAEESGAPEKPGINTPAGRTSHLLDKTNASGLSAYSSEKAKNDAMTAAEMGGAGLAVGAGIRAKGYNDPTRVSVNTKALQESSGAQNQAQRMQSVPPEASKLEAAIKTPAASQAKFNYTITPSGKPLFPVGSKLLAAAGGDPTAAARMVQVFEGTDDAAKSRLASDLMTKQKSVSFTRSGKQLGDFLGGSSATANEIQKHFGYTIGNNGKPTLLPNSPLMTATGMNSAQAGDIARQLESGTMAERQALAKKLMSPGWLQSNRIPLTDAGLKTDAQIAFREANPRVLKTDSMGQALSKRLKNTYSGAKRIGGGGLRGGLLGLALGLGNMGRNALWGANSDADRGKIMADSFNELINSKQITNPAQLQQLQNLAASASQGITQDTAEFFAKKYEDILQAATAGK